ncbi:hypothetical protein B0H16DRAFT_897021 [Mycena metata]|uniref:Transmembrane protein n=1 Tax=Mycena metata TaxID=1033252 RepID=A0AAD7N8F1_9AGAR|nr:hypothetical protein B0H16DRAFT_897021 [Mycena metata]
MRCDVFTFFHPRGHLLPSPRPPLLPSPCFILFSSHCLRLGLLPLPFPSLHLTDYTSTYRAHRNRAQRQQHRSCSRSCAGYIFPAISLLRLCFLPSFLAVFPFWRRLPLFLCGSCSSFGFSSRDARGPSSFILHPLSVPSLHAHAFALGAWSGS